jgi:hypothetical protein
MLHLTGFPKTLTALALVGACAIPCALAALAYSAFSRSSVGEYQVIATPYALSVPAQKVPTQNVTSISEVSLQETLDRLGYTVNVPAVYGGHTLQRWNDYRLSTQDNSLAATHFHGLKSSRFTKVSEQGMLAGNLDFGVADAQGHKDSLLKPDHNQNTYWISADDGDSCRATLTDSERFYINDTGNTFRIGALTSSPQANSDGAQHLLALPARTGGQWVDEGNNTGHWEGGTDTGGVLLCWEDWNDYDYQDLVILAENVAADQTSNN